MRAELSSVTKSKAVVFRMRMLAWMPLQKPENGTDHYI